MLPKIEFNKTAFKHGVTEEDIRWVFYNPEYGSPVEDLENK